MSCIIRFLCPLALTLSAGCYTVNADLPGTLRGDVATADTEKLGSFTVEKTNTYFLKGLIGAPGADFFGSEISEEVRTKGGDGVANLVFDSQMAPVDVLVGCVTCNIVTPRTYKVTGDVVRIRRVPVAGTPPDGRRADTLSTSQFAQAY